MAIGDYHALIRDARLREKMGGNVPPEPDITRCEGARLAQGNALKPQKWMQTYAGWTCSYCDQPTYQHQEHRYAMFYHQTCADVAMLRNRVFDE